MGQKTNPIGNRLGIIRGWDSNWFGGRNYGDKLAEDEKIRKGSKILVMIILVQIKPPFNIKGFVSTDKLIQRVK